jgi:site-specific DNA recombinase
VCAGRHIPMSTLDDLVIANVKERLFTPRRLEIILEGLVAMQASRDSEVQKRRSALEADLTNTNDRLSRLYRAIEDDIVSLDDHLKDRIETLKTQRDIVVATLERIVTQARTTSIITPEHLQSFSRLMHEKLDTGDVQAKKAYLRSVIAQIEVGDDKVRIVGEKASLAAVIAGNPPETAHVRGFVRKWRARRDSNS